MRKILSTAAALVIAAAISVPAAAQMNGMRGGMHGDGAYGCGMMCGGMMGGGMMGGMLCGTADDLDWGDIADKLGLDEDQKGKIMEHNRETVRKMMQARNELQLQMFDLNNEMKMADPDQKKIDSLIDDISSTRKQMLKQRIAAMNTMREIFTDEQWMKFGHMRMEDRDEDMPMGMRGGRRMMR